MKPDATRIALIALIALVGGCAKAKNAGESTAPVVATVDRSDGAMPEDAASGREFGDGLEFDDLQAEFDRLDADLSSEGIVGTTQATAGVTPKSTSETDAAGRCERICDLKTAICEVSERICDLAEEHQGEAKYADACTRAEERCEQATDACDRCE